MTSGSKPAHRRSRLVLAAVAAVSLTGLSARAKGVDDATRDAARELAHRGEAASARGDYARAADLYRRAYALVPAPTLSIREARALAKTGKLVEAVEAYVRTIRTALTPDSPAVFRQAVTQARAELAALRPSVPQLKIRLAGSQNDSKSVTVQLDGRKLPAALIGVTAPIDPGTHRLTASSSTAHATAQVSLKAGQSKTVTLTLPRAPETAPSAPPPTVSDTVDLEPPHAHGAAQRTWGFVGLGVGAAGLGVGLVTGLMATSRHSSAEQACPDNRCIAGSAGQRDVNAFRTLRTVSTIGYIAGAVGVATGVTLLLTLPSQHRERIGLRASFGPGSASLSGRF